MSDDNAIIVEDGDLVSLDPNDQSIIKWNWHTKALNTGVSITTSTMTITALRPSPVSVTSITRSGSTATVTTAAAHGFSSNDYATIAGADQTDYNVTAQITVTSVTTFTFTVANAPTTPATGTITAATGLGKDNATILSVSPYNSRYTGLRLLGGGAAAAGKLFELANKIVTDESPTQTKERSIRVRITNEW